MDNPKRIDCHKCAHYYVTWEEKFPHGCRAMKFKSKRLPSDAVMESSRMPCMLYTLKNCVRKGS
ncbi:MAG: uracil-DNA glycosylase [Desulfobacteraceae bacterium]|nr:MAG: uracil-DNA glycosylase [Desulfobacteraceae bacterium]